jgi:hypothetical protein
MLLSSIGEPRIRGVGNSVDAIMFWTGSSLIFTGALLMICWIWYAGRRKLLCAGSG